MTTSIPGSISRPPTISSSSWRLAGLALCPCETTTAMRLAMMHLLVHLSFDRPLRHFPDGGEVLQVTRRCEQRIARSVNLEQPTAFVFIQIDRRRVGKQLLIKPHQPAGN